MPVLSPTLIEQLERLDLEATRPFPNSRKVYVSGSRLDLRVPMREISLTAPHPPVYVYDTSGPYTDPEAAIDLRKGLPELRAAWIEERGDSETLSRPSSGFGQARLEDPKRKALRFEHPLHHPRRGKPGRNVTQMHYARRGIVTPEMEFIAIRETLRREAAASALSGQHLGQSFGAAIPERITPEFVRDEVARGRAIIPANINHPELEPMIIGRNFLVKINANIGNSAIGSSIQEEVEKLLWAIRWGA